MKFSDYFMFYCETVLDYLFSLYTQSYTALSLTLDTLLWFGRRSKAKACKSLRGLSHLMSQIWNVWLWQPTPSMHSQGPSNPFFMSLYLWLFPDILLLSYTHILSNRNSRKQQSLLKVVQAHIPPDYLNYIFVCAHMLVHESSPSVMA